MIFPAALLPFVSKEARTKNIGQGIMVPDSKRSRYTWRFTSQCRISKNFSTENLLLACLFKAILTKVKEDNIFVMDSQSAGPKALTIVFLILTSFGREL